jgi:glycosyltransferase involved in cell wall biosynthesis
MKILHIITSLGSGGAESILSSLVTNDKTNEHIVIVLKNKGEYGGFFIDSNILFYELKMHGWISGIKGVVNLYFHLRLINPDVVQTWLFHADMIGGIVAKISGVQKIFWGVHTANIGLLPFATRVVVRGCSILSYFIPNKIICCANATQQVLSDNYYSVGKLTTINNGYNNKKYTFNGDRLDIKTIDHSLKSNNFLIGFVARWNVYKNIPMLLNALRICTASVDNIRCLFVGSNLDVNNTELTKLIKDAGLIKNITLLGHMSNVSSFMRTMDICVLSSVSEAFPNVIVESMLCGTPCVSTDVGDVANIIGETGWISSPLDSNALAASVILAANEKAVDVAIWNLRRKKCRKRAVKLFSLDRMIKNYIKVWSRG